MTYRLNMVVIRKDVEVDLCNYKIEIKWQLAITYTEPLINEIVRDYSIHTSLTELRPDKHPRYVVVIMTAIPLIAPLIAELRSRLLPNDGLPKTLANFGRV